MSGITNLTPTELICPFPSKPRSGTYPLSASGCLCLIFPHLLFSVVMAQTDIEKKYTSSVDDHPAIVDNETFTPSTLRARIAWKLKTFGVETHGCVPSKYRGLRVLIICFHRIRESTVLVQDQTYTHFINLFFLWLSCNTGMITYAPTCSIFTQCYSHQNIP